MPARNRRKTPKKRLFRDHAVRRRASARVCVALWRVGERPSWSGEDGCALLRIAPALFEAPEAVEARRAWASAPDRSAVFYFKHAASENREIAEWTVAAFTPGTDDAQVCASVFHHSEAFAPYSTDMVSNWQARRLLRRRLEAAINAGDPAAIVAFGVDNLSALNQVYGFDAADSVLSEVSARIRAAAEREAGAAATVRHLSGSKFGLIAHGLDEAAARRLAIEVQNAVAGEPAPTRYGGVATTVSAGVAMQSPDSRGGDRPIIDQAHAIMARALDSLAAARRVGPSALRESGPEDAPRELLDERRRIIRETLASLESGRVSVAFQPIVSSGSRRPAFHECLARIRASDGSMMSAGAFVPVIERLGQVRLLDRRMLDAVFDALEDAPRTRLSLNVSAQTLRDAEWLAIYARRAASAPQAAARLIVEITESSASGDPETAIAFMKTVRAQGAAIALDDFGAGYTAFRQLRDFRFDFLKIDGSFVADIASNPDNQMFVRAMVEIAQHFEMATIAEFVETETEAEALTALSVPYQQGYLHGAPSLELDSAESSVDKAMTA